MKTKRDPISDALRQKAAHGGLRYGDDVMRVVVVRLILEVAQTARIDLPLPLARLVDRVLRDLGLDGDARRDGPRLLARVHAAMPAELQTIFEQAMREAVAEGATPSQAAAALLAANDGLKGFVNRAPPPKNSVAAGPMARFLVQKKDG